MAWVAYDNWKLNQMSGGEGTAAFVIDFDNASEDLRVLLLDTGTTIDRADITVANLIAGASDTEVTGGSYARQTLSTVGVAVATNVVTVSSDASSAGVTWAQNASGFASNAEYAVLYKHVGADASNPVIMYYDLGSASGYNITAGDLTLQFDSSGELFTFTH